MAQHRSLYPYRDLDTITNRWHDVPAFASPNEGSRARWSYARTVMKPLYLDIWVRMGHNEHLGLKGKHRPVSNLKKILWRNA